MKNLKRSIKYLAVFSEPPSDDGVPRTLSMGGDGVESEGLESLRKRRNKEDGTGRGKGRPGGLRRNRNPLDCPSDGPGRSKGKGRGKGEFRQAQKSQLQEFINTITQALKVGFEIDQYEKTTLDMDTMNEVQRALDHLKAAEKTLRGLGNYEREYKKEAQLKEYDTPAGYEIKQYSWDDVYTNPPKWEETPFDLSLVQEFGYEEDQDLTSVGELIESWDGNAAGSIIITDIERGLDETPNPLGPFTIIKEKF